jgi:hypothetical protein
MLYLRTEFLRLCVSRARTIRGQQTSTHLSIKFEKSDQSLLSLRHLFRDQMRYLGRLGA